MLGSRIAASLAILIFALAETVGVDPEAHAMQAGQTFRDCPDCPEMVAIPAGTFAMGSSAADTERDIEAATEDKPTFVKFYTEWEHPQHSVTISQSFGLGKYHVTRSEFAIFVRETGYSIAGDCAVWANHKFDYSTGAGWQSPGFKQTDLDPVVCVSWQDAQAYIDWLNRKLRSRESTTVDGPYRLPSEAEWEYAARAGTLTARWWGNSKSSGNANCDGCGSRWDKRQTAPVGSFGPNPFGLYDMLGNAWEWTEDCWNENYTGAPAHGGAWITGKCESRVMRGGGWTNHPWVLRSADRSNSKFNERKNYIGLRVARSLQ